MSYMVTCGYIWKDDLTKGLVVKCAITVLISQGKIAAFPNPPKIPCYLKFSSHASSSAKRPKRLFQLWIFCSWSDLIQMWGPKRSRTTECSNLTIVLSNASDLEGVRNLNPHTDSQTSDSSSCGKPTVSKHEGNTSSDGSQLHWSRCHWHSPGHLLSKTHLLTPPREDVRPLSWWRDF